MLIAVFKPIKELFVICCVEVPFILLLESMKMLYFIRVVLFVKSLE